MWVEFLKCFHVACFEEDHVACFEEDHVEAPSDALLDSKLWKERKKREINGSVIFFLPCSHLCHSILFLFSYYIYIYIYYIYIFYFVIVVFLNFVLLFYMFLICFQKVNVVILIKLIITVALGWYMLFVVGVIFFFYIIINFNCKMLGIFKFQIDLDPLF